MVIFGPIDQLGWARACFGVTLAINLLIVEVGQFLLTSLTGQRLEHALVFAGLLSVIITFYDRYRPIHVARFAADQHA